jgi:acyl carrier protein
MNNQDLLPAISKTLQELFDIPADKITLEARLYEDLDIDSIDAVDLIIKMRKITGKKVEPEMFKSVRTIGDVITALESAK